MMADPVNLPARRLGRDELNLCEFPFALLSTKAREATPLRIEFRDGAKEWVVRGDAEYGLPTAQDVEVYVALMELTREQGFPAKVEFCRYDVLRRLGWAQDGRNYVRVVTALDRLVTVTIQTKNAFFDAANKAWERKKAFHILEAYDLVERRDPSADSNRGMSWIRWSPELYANIQAGHIKSLNVELFLSLRPHAAQALYRYLDAKRGGDGKSGYRIGIKKLAWEHLGLSRNYYPSQIKRELDKAHVALEKAHFLAGWSYQPMKDGEEMVVYRFAEPAALPPPSASPAQCAVAELDLELGRDPLAELAERLHTSGVSRRQALQLVRQKPEECARQLEWLPFREAKSSGAVLYRSICDGWSAPPAWLEAQAKEQRAEKTRKKATQTACAATETPEKASAETAFDTWWAAQPEAQRAAWSEEAHVLLRAENQTLAELGQKHPHSVMYQEGLRPYRKRVSGYQSE